MLVLTALALGIGLALGVHHFTWWLRLHHPSAAGLLGGAVAVPFALMTLAAVASFVWNGTLPSEVVGIIVVGLAVIWVLAGALGGLHAWALSRHWLPATLAVFLDVVAAAVLVYWGTRLRGGLLRWVHRNGGWSVGGYDSTSIDVFGQWTYLSLIGMLIVLSVLRPIQHLQHQQHE